MNVFFNDSMEIDTKIKKEEMEKGMDDLTDLFIDCFSKPDTSKATEEINTYCKSMLCEMDENIKVLTDKITLILKGKK